MSLISSLSLLTLLFQHKGGLSPFSLFQKNFGMCVQIIFEILFESIIQTDIQTTHADLSFLPYRLELFLSVGLLLLMIMFGCLPTPLKYTLPRSFPHVSLYHLTSFQMVVLSHSLHHQLSESAVWRNWRH